MEESGELDSATKGKQGEFIVIGKLLLKGHKVYTPVVDTGVDFLVDVGNGNYKELQVKYREGDTAFTARNFPPRDNFYIICYFHGRSDDDFWIVPSKIFKELGRPVSIRGRDYIQLSIGKEGSSNYNALAGYHSNWGVLLAGASKETMKTVASVSRRVEGEHFKQSDFEPHVLKALFGKKNPVTTAEIEKSLTDKLEFSPADKKIGKNKMPRWRKTLQYALYHRLKDSKLIAKVGVGSWMITEKGIERISNDPSISGPNAPSLIIGKYVPTEDEV